MNSKSDITEFLKKELKAMADKLGDVTVDVQGVFDDTKAKKVKVKSKKVK